MTVNVKRTIRCDETSCASANYTMVANALGFDVGLEDVLRITRGTLGNAQFWNWCLANGVEIECVSKINYADKISPAWVAEFFAARSDGSEDFAGVLANPNFKFENRAPTIEDLKRLHAAGYALEIMGDGWLMYGDCPEAQLLHRVFITNITPDAIYFHDPDIVDNGENYRASPDDIAAALSVDGAEITGYRRKS
ncbi:MAG: hypothetical protein FWD15_05445 [Alphaproteobacteria bacterium]|nr:hypothetical protein [Alphaproteobacteria bacterium]